MVQFFKAYAYVESFVEVLDKYKSYTNSKMLLIYNIPTRVLINAVAPGYTIRLPNVFAHM